MYKKKKKKVIIPLAKSTIPLKEVTRKTYITHYENIRNQLYSQGKLERPILKYNFY